MNLLQNRRGRRLVAFVALLIGAVLRNPSFLLAAVLISATPAAAQQPCGGVERWAVKVAADPNSQIKDHKRH
jgi:hypothetical protein